MPIVLQRVVDVSVAEVASRPTVVDGAEVVASAYDFDKHPYFLWMRDPATTLDEFRSTQVPYRHFVEHFSRAVTAVLARIPSMERRLATIYANVAEEHGQGALSGSHRSTFLEYLTAIGVRGADLDRECPLRVAAAYEGLIGFCLMNPAEMGAAAIGIIEYTHIKISTILSQNMHDRFWGNVEAQHHYRLHAEIDADHALDLFAVCDDEWTHEPMRRRIAYSMIFGAQIWWTLFDSMCPAEPIAASATDGLRSLLESGPTRADRVLVNRPHPRFMCELPVLVRSADKPPQAVIATAISVCGVLLAATAPAPADTEVDLVITFPGRLHPVVVGGIVRFNAQDGGAARLGVEFVFASETERSALVDAMRSFRRATIEPPPPALGSRRPPAASGRPMGM